MKSLDDFKKRAWKAHLRIANLIPNRRDGPSPPRIIIASIIITSGNYPSSSRRITAVALGCLPRNRPPSSHTPSATATSIPNIFSTSDVAVTRRTRPSSIGGRVKELNRQIVQADFRETRSSHRVHELPSRSILGKHIVRRQRPRESAEASGAAVSCGAPVGRGRGVISRRVRWRRDRRPLRCGFKRWRRHVQ